MMNCGMNMDGFMKTLEYLKDPNWSLSMGEDTNKIHFRQNHYHTLIDPETGIDSVHYDEIDPHESLESLLKHMWQSKKGKKVLKGIAAAGVVYLLGK